MEPGDDGPRVVRVTIGVAAPAPVIFELIADPTSQPLWDGNDNLAAAATGQRVRAVGDVFVTTLTGGAVRENHVVAFTEGREIAWRPSEVGRAQPGHEWRWTLEPVGPARTRVTHTYDWRDLGDERRLARARATTPERLVSSARRLAALAEARAAANGGACDPG